MSWYLSFLAILLNSLRIILAYFSSSLIIIWFIIELNLISFIGVIMFFPRKIAKSIAIKYFSFQVNVSVILFLLVLLKGTFNVARATLMLRILITKVGIAPFHLWFVSIISKVEWPAFLWIAVPQKLIPLYMIRLSIINSVSILLLVLSVAVSLAHRIMQLKIKKVVALSSVFSLNWILLSIISSSGSWSLFFIIYRFFSRVLVLTLAQTVKRSSSCFQITKPLSWLIIGLSLLLAGVPPRPLFFLKISIIVEMINQGLEFMSVVMITASLIVLFMYINLILNFLVFSHRSRSLRAQPNSTNLVLLTYLFVVMVFYLVLFN